MDFLRQHVFLIVCALMAVAGIALIVTGARAMPKVLEEMGKVEGLHRSLANVQSRPVNLAGIEAAQQRINLVLEDREKVFTKARELYGYEPLVPGALPEGDALKRLDFRDKYIAEMDRLLDSLVYGTPAKREDFARWQDRIADEEAAERERGADPDASVIPSASTGQPTTPAGVLTQAGAKRNAPARASMAAAQKTYVYAIHYKAERLPDEVSSLDVWPVMRDVTTVDAPEPWDIWMAQIGYWIQKDVIGAIASLNEERAKQAEENGEHAWVGIMPVKEVISIRLAADYIPREGDEVFGTPPGGYEAALPPGTPETVFTGSGQSETYDVVQFSVKLIMDFRDIPRFVDRVCGNSFHTLLRISYEAVPPNRNMVGKIYGSGPVVNVLMDFETIMLGEVFRALIPESVCEFYEINCPERTEEDEGG